MKKTKIDWCDCTANPVVGCSNGCPYCYARKLNDRFHFVNDWSKPEFFPERLKELRNKKPKAVFMNSMSDVGNWTQKQVWVVFDAIRENPQHSYIFLTKGFCDEASLLEVRDYYNSLMKRENIFIGKTVDRSSRFSICHFDFLSIEPILEPINCELIGLNAWLKCVIIGAETGNRKGKIIPKKEWIDDIVKACDVHEIAVFMKESLREIMGDDFRQDILPWSKK